MKTVSVIKAHIEDKLRARFGVPVEKATDGQIFTACALLIREEMSRRAAGELRDSRGRHVHYLSMEFLMGRSLAKNAFNLGIEQELTQALRELGREPADIFEAEPDAGLGNGGLGRLAACYMDSLTTLDVPATGYSICYELGMFRQKLEGGVQTEQADDWLPMGESWLVPCWEDAVEVRFGGRLEPYWDYAGVYHAQHRDYTPVIALPRDMRIAGYGTDRVNTLRLWEARSENSLDMYLFSGGQYVRSLEQRTMTEVITKVLYPADDHMEGKSLRLKQQYFFVSATVQSIVRRHVQEHGGVMDFAKHHVLHINDTHPTLVIPELMRIFMDEHGLGWDAAWAVVTDCVAYTNHTVLSEALESWPQGLVQSLLPRVFEIICEIDRRRREALSASYGGDVGRIEKNAVLSGGRVHMANLCLSACFRINGVSELHGEILKKDLFRDDYRRSPERFLSITNGIDHRRWLAQINPGLSGLIRELLGGDEWLRQPEMLSGLEAFAGDAAVLEQVGRIKQANKAAFADFVRKTGAAPLDTEAIFDVQVKRLHEYKRQLLCAMHICQLRNMLHDDPDMDFRPRCFIFGAKAASGYHVAKRIIRFICSLAREIDNDPVCRGRLRVLFVENYRVSVAEKLMPAAQISEQISTAGKEASGTGNMKLMMNGAVTIGTLDGANVEMLRQLGQENMFLFGLHADEVTALKAAGYDPASFVAGDAGLKRVIEQMNAGFSDGESYADLSSRLVYGGDEFMLLADFSSYRDAHERLYRVMGDEKKRNRLSLLNTARSGLFAADRAVAEYVEKIWN